MSSLKDAHQGEQYSSVWLVADVGGKTKRGLSLNNALTLLLHVLFSIFLFSDLASLPSSIKEERYFCVRPLRLNIVKLQIHSREEDPFKPGTGMFVSQPDSFRW